MPIALDVAVFGERATSADLAQHLVRTYRSVLVFCKTRRAGRAFCAELNAVGPGRPGGDPRAAFVDCRTRAAERAETAAAFRAGRLAFVVNVRVLAAGLDAPATNGMCFVGTHGWQPHVGTAIGSLALLHRSLDPTEPTAAGRIARVIVPVFDSNTVAASAAARDFLHAMVLYDECFERTVVHHRAGCAVTSCGDATDDGHAEYCARVSGCIEHHVNQLSLTRSVASATVE
jgi:hypothetical protein